MTRTHFAIFDKNAGHLQYCAAHKTAEDALAAFDAEVGIDPHGAGISVNDWTIYHITAEEAEAVEQWWHGGAAADTFPLSEHRSL